MPPPFTSIGPLTIQTYTLLIGIGIAAGVGIAALMGWLRGSAPVARVVDAALIAMAAGLLLGRALHVALHWAYFRDNTGEILRFTAGGLSWHGALIGALLGLWLAGRLRRVDRPRLLDDLAPSLPLLALLAWWGCGAARCGFGAEVENLAHYPSLLVWEVQDIFNMRAPRFATQPLGMMFSGTLLVVTLLITARGWLAGRRFWLTLALLAAGMFALGFLRGDYAEIFAGLRADQWLDLLLVAAGLGLTLRPAQPRSSPGAAAASVAGQ
jgi:phosphatidylglycerol---prolipoprotein diacylglyceryl transferase